MDIVVYIKNIDDSTKIFKLLKNSDLEFKVEAIEDVHITNVVGEKVKKLPHVVIDGERVGGYYDLVEYLINKDIINYAGELTWKMNN